MTLLIDHFRDVIGLPMNGLHHGYHVGWTTDSDKAHAAMEAGARCTFCRAAKLRDADGWEVAFAVGREYEPSLEH